MTGASTVAIRSPMNEDDEVQRRRNELLAKLNDNSRAADSQATWLEFFLTTSFYGNLLFGGLAVVLGLVKQWNVPSEYISLSAAVSTSLAILPRQGKYWAKADWHYAVRDTANGLANRLEFEMPIPVLRENVAAISLEWRTQREKLGARMAAIHDAPVAESNGGRPGSADGKKPKP